VSSDQIVAFGDGDADIPLLKTACLGIAICPSNKRVQEAAMFSIEEEPIDRAIELIEQQLPHMVVKRL
jgi:phosphoserine phosphatase